jgi:hypothetical protein
MSRLKGREHSGVTAATSAFENLRRRRMMAGILVRMYEVRRRLWRLLEYLPIATLVVVASACCTGCIWLALPGLAYEGYQYGHLVNKPEVSGRTSNAPSATRGRASSDHSIE